jgi:hypothetical protein
VPDDCCRGLIVKLPKKRTLSYCNYWRGITIISAIVRSRPRKLLEECQKLSSLRNEQAGFRKQQGCTDQIFVIRNIIEQCTEWQVLLYVNFVDFEKVFDSIHRDSLWSILRHYGIQSKLVHLIKSFYNNCRCSIEYNNTFLM